MSVKRDFARGRSQIVSYNFCAYIPRPKRHSNRGLGKLHTYVPLESFGLDINHNEIYNNPVILSFFVWYQTSLNKYEPLAGSVFENIFSDAKQTIPNSIIDSLHVNILESLFTNIKLTLSLYTKGKSCKY